MTASLYICATCSLLRLHWNSAGFGWMGNAAKGGMEIYTPVHISCMCYVSCLKVTRWLQHDVRDGLFVHSVRNDAEWFENFWNWLRKHENVFLVHDVLFHQLCG